MRRIFIVIMIFLLVPLYSGASVITSKSPWGALVRAPYNIADTVPIFSALMDSAVSLGLSWVRFQGLTNNGVDCYVHWKPTEGFTFEFQQYVDPHIRVLQKHNINILYANYLGGVPCDVTGSPPDLFPYNYYDNNTGIHYENATSSPLYDFGGKIKGVGGRYRNPQWRDFYQKIVERYGLGQGQGSEDMSWLTKKIKYWYICNCPGFPGNTWSSNWFTDTDPTKPDEAYDIRSYLNSHHRSDGTPLTLEDVVKYKDYTEHWQGAADWKEVAGWNENTHVWTVTIFPSQNFSQYDGVDQQLHNYLTELWMPIYNDVKSFFYSYIQECADAIHDEDPDAKIVAPGPDCTGGLGFSAWVLAHDKAGNDVKLCVQFDFASNYPIPSAEDWATWIYYWEPKPGYSSWDPANPDHGNGWLPIQTYHDGVGAATWNDFFANCAQDNVNNRPYVDVLESHGYNSVGNGTNYAPANFHEWYWLRDLWDNYLTTNSLPPRPFWVTEFGFWSDDSPSKKEDMYRYAYTAFTDTPNDPGGEECNIVCTWDNGWGAWGDSRYRDDNANYLTNAQNWRDGFDWENDKIFPYQFSTGSLGGPDPEGCLISYNGQPTPAYNWLRKFTHDHFASGDIPDFSSVPDNEWFMSDAKEATAYNNGRRLLVDASGNLHCVFTSWHNEIMYAMSDDGGASWKHKRVVGEGKYPAMAIDEDGGINVCWVEAIYCEGRTPAYSYSLHFRRKTASGWGEDVILSQAFPKPPGYVICYISTPSIAATSDTIHFVVDYKSAMVQYYTPCLIHCKFAIQNYPNNVINNMQIFTLDEEGDFPSIALAGNNPHICWEKDGKIYYRYHTRSSWSGKILISGNDVAYHPCLNVIYTPPPPGQAYLPGATSTRMYAVWQTDNGEIHWRKGNLVFFNQWNGEPPPPWSPNIETVSNSSSQPGEYPVMASGSQVLWRGTTDSKIYYAHRESSGWTIEPALTSGSPKDYFPQIALKDPSGNTTLYYAYTEGDNSPYEIKVETKSVNVPPPPTIWSGNVTSDMTWNYKVYVTGDVIVDPGVTLTIEPGATLYFANTDNQSGGIDPTKSELIVQGKLIAQGTETDSIRFTGLDGIDGLGGQWYGIRFEGAGSDSSIIDHCVVEYGTRGISCESASPIIQNSLIRENYLPEDPAGGGGIWCDYSQATISGNTIIDNAPLPPPPPGQELTQDIPAFSGYRQSIDNIKQNRVNKVSPAFARTNQPLIDKGLNLNNKLARSKDPTYPAGRSGEYPATATATAGQAGQVNWFGTGDSTGFFRNSWGKNIDTSSIPWSDSICWSDSLGFSDSIPLLDSICWTDSMDIPDPIQYLDSLPDSTDAGIACWNSSPTITNNYLARNGNVAVYLENCSNSNVTGNYMNTHCMGIVLQPSSGNTIASNTANSNTELGIYLWNSQNNIIKDNTADSNGVFGIYLYESSNDTVMNNTTKNNPVGMRCSNSRNNLISGNTFNDNINGLFFEPGCDSNIITGNNASNNSGGIMVQSCSGNQITSNTANFNPWGIAIFENSNNNVLTKNTADSNTYGIYIGQSSGNTITENTANHNTETGFFVTEGSNNTLTDNNASYNGWRGFYIIFNSGNILTANTVTNNSYLGIELGESSRNTITDNTVNNNSSGISIFLNSDSNMVANNTLSFNDWDGLHLFGNSSGNTFANNTVNSNQGNGIWLSGNSNNNILTNNTTNSNTWGIFLTDYSDSNTLIDNTSNDNIWGIYIEQSSDNIVTGNTANNNTGTDDAWGIGGRTASNNTIRNNTVSGNGTGIAFDWGSTYNTVDSNTANNNNVGIVFWEGNLHNTIEGNTTNYNNIDGILIGISDSNTIENNTVNNNSRDGIHIGMTASNNTIRGNGTNYNGQCGIGLYAGSYNNTVSNNTTDYNRAGIFVISNYNRVEDNHANSNNWVGIHLFWGGHTCVNNRIDNNIAGLAVEGADSISILRNNLMNNNRYNFCLGTGWWSPSQFYQDIDTTNKVDGKPICYYVNRNNFTIPENAGFVGLVNCKNVIGENLVLRNNSMGVVLVDTRNSIIKNNAIDSSCDCGIFSYASSNNTISNNTIKHILGPRAGWWSVGVFVGDNSNKNVIENNVIDSNFVDSVITDGIYVWSSDSNRIVKNTCKLNTRYGIGISGDVMNFVELNGNDVRENATGVYFNPNTPALMVGRYNTITANDTGVLLMQGNADLGNLAVTGGEGHNYIYDNNDWDLCNFTPNAILAQGNRWCCPTSPDIDGKILDDDENALYGAVDFSNYFKWGLIPLDNVWQDVVFIGGKTIIPEGNKLTINAGTVLRFAAGMEPPSGLTVLGELDLKGNKNNPVIFTSDALEPKPGDWCGIIFGSQQFALLAKPIDRNANLISGNSTYQYYGSNDNKNSSLGEPLKSGDNKVKLDYVQIEYAKRGVSAFDKKLDFKHSKILNTLEYGIYGKNGEYDIKENQIEGGIYIDSSKKVDFKKNIVTSGTYGLYLKNIKNIDVKEDTISGNDYGIYLTGFGDGDIKNNTIRENRIGIALGGAMKTKLKENQIVNNSDTGLVIRDSAKPELKKGNNAIYGSGSFDLVNNTVYTVYAEKNYWGTNNLDTIRAHIWDYYDNSTLGKVIFEPILEGWGYCGGPQLSNGISVIPLVFKLNDIEPNPFKELTTIKYQLPRKSNVSLQVYDKTGRVVKTLVNEEKETGYYTVNWDGKEYPAGIYFVRFIAGDYKETKKLILMK